MVLYAVPRKLSEIVLEKGYLVWEPYVRIVYKTKRGKVDVIVDSVMPSVCRDPIVAVLTARKTKLIKLSEEKPLEGKVLNHDLSGYEIIDLFKSAYAKADELSKTSIDEFYERAQLDVDWSRYRAILLPSKRLLTRKEPIFRYLTGKDQTSPYTIGLFLKGLIESGLKITSDIDAEIKLSEKTYYPLVITNDLTFYEPAWKLDESILYSWLVNQYPDAREFFRDIWNR